MNTEDEEICERTNTRSIKAGNVMLCTRKSEFHFENAIYLTIWENHFCSTCNYMYTAKTLNVVWVKIMLR